MDTDTEQRRVIVAMAADCIAEFSESISYGISPLLDEWSAFVRRSYPVMSDRFQAACAPMLLGMKDRRGRNIVRGRRRKRIKLLRSQKRRGVLV